MIEINQCEPSVFDFNLEITGSASGSPEIRFTIGHPAGHLLSYPTVPLDGGGYRVCLPILDSILPAGEHPCALEVFLGDRYFKPLFDTVCIVEKPAASVSSFSKVNSVEPPTVTVMSRPQPQPETTVSATPAYEAKEVKPEAPKPKKFTEADEGLFAALLKKKK